MVDELDPTVKNMKELNFPETRKDHFYLKKQTSDKTIRRNKVKDKYDVLLFVGDNLATIRSFLQKEIKITVKILLASIKILWVKNS